MNIRRSESLVCAIAIVAANFLFPAEGRAQTDAGSVPATTRLSIVVQGMTSPAAPLHWGLYSSQGALPHLFSRGQAYRKGVAERFGNPAVIEVGEVAEGIYFAIVGQDIDGNKDIGAFSEPRGYSGYAGCLTPKWKKGAQIVSAGSAVIHVVLGCNASSREDTDSR